MNFGTASARSGRPVVMGEHGSAIAGHHLAAQAAYDVLRSGGNAIDAAITAAAALAVLKPDACGLGADLFMLYEEAATGDVHALNASGPAPQLAGPAAFGERIEPWGLRAATVPGAVHGWQNALERFGTRSLAEALAPAIELALGGMPVSVAFAATLAQSMGVFQRFPSTAAVFAPGGSVPPAGATLKQPDAARTLVEIAAGGPAAYYSGPFAHALDRFAEDDGAFMRASDLEPYQSEWREPLSVRFRGVELVGQPPVSVGAIVLEGLKILEHTGIAALDDGSPDFIHLHVEAMKIATADLRAYIGDPNFAAQQPLAEMLSAAYTAERARGIASDRAQSPAAGVLAVNAGSDTSYVAVMDADGNAVSLLQSVFAVFGCGLVVPGTGVLMNNRMTGFSLDPASPNVLAPGKRAMHTLNPLLVRRDGQTIMCLGTPGGPSQTYTNSLLLLRLFDKGYDVQSAVEAPRWFVAPDGKLHIETGVGDAVLTELERRGHTLVRVTPWHATMGGAGVMRRNEHGVRECGADPRRESYAVAY